MRIICTKKEKEDLLHALTQTCLYVEDDTVRCRYSGQAYQCQQCLERHIEFDMVEDGKGGNQ